ncbi:MAG: NTP transferase domain-containing protein [Odoribacteraceae bacterium]|jgi:NDP-sugar pyrophosphorylase family protein|nr:NTP transferase domain-containing protein [Odoribacteraceae bacterium]
MKANYHNRTTLLVMAAGLGSRFGGLKQLALLGPKQKTLLHYSIRDAARAGFNKVVFIIRDTFEGEFREAIGKEAEARVDTYYCFQEMNRLPGGMTPVERDKPWGTAHAIWSAKELINEPFIAINADDFYGEEAFIKLREFLAANDDERLFGLAGYRLDATLSENGSVARGVCAVDPEGYLRRVIETTRIARDNGEIRDLSTGAVLDPATPVSMNFWGFTPFIFNEIERQFVDFYKEKHLDPKAEMYIPGVVDKLLEQQRVRVKVIDINARWFGVTYKEDADLVNAALQRFEDQGLYADL